MLWSQTNERARAILESEALSLTNVRLYGESHIMHGVGFYADRRGGACGGCSGARSGVYKTNALALVGFLNRKKAEIRLLSRRSGGSAPERFSAGDR